MDETGGGTGRPVGANDSGPIWLGDMRGEAASKEKMEVKKMHNKHQRAYIPRQKVG